MQQRGKPTKDNHNNTFNNKKHNDNKPADSASAFFEAGAIKAGIYPPSSYIPTYCDH